MAVRILIVEDEAVLAQTAKSMLESLGYEIAGIALRYADALTMFDSAEFDIALLDINLGEGGDGIQLAETLNEKYHKPFMFLTSYADQATIERAKPTRPAAYLMKPFNKKDLFSAIEIAMMKQEPEEGASIVIKDGGLTVKIQVDDILWLKSDNIYVEINTTSKRYIQRNSLEHLLEELPTDAFARTHRSYAVNISKIAAVKSQYVLIGDEQIPLSRKNREAIMERFSGS